MGFALDFGSLGFGLGFTMVVCLGQDGVDSRIIAVGMLCLFSIEKDVVGFGNALTRWAFRSFFIITPNILTKTKKLDYKGLG